MQEVIPVLIAVLSTIAKMQKQPKCLSIDKWVKKWWYIIYTMEYDLTMKKWNLAICNSRDGPRKYYTEWNKWDTETPRYDFTYLESEKQNKGINKTETSTYIQRTFWRLPDRKELGGVGEKGKGLRYTNCQLQKQSQGCKVQHKEYSQ